MTRREGRGRRAVKVGVAVYCTKCQQMKKPVGRDASLLTDLCDRECPGYSAPPHVGCLWPGETEKDFGYPVGKHGWLEKHKADLTGSESTMLNLTDERQGF